MTGFFVAILFTLVYGWFVAPEWRPEYDLVP